MSAPNMTQLDQQIASLNKDIASIDGSIADEQTSLALGRSKDGTAIAALRQRRSDLADKLAGASALRQREADRVASEEATTKRAALDRERATLNAELSAAAYETLLSEVTQQAINAESVLDRVLTIVEKRCDRARQANQRLAEVHRELGLPAPPSGLGGWHVPAVRHVVQQAVRRAQIKAGRPIVQGREDAAIDFARGKVEW